MWQRAGESSGGSSGGSWEQSTMSVTIPAMGNVNTHIDTTNKSIYIAGKINNARIAALVQDGQVLDSTIANYITVSITSSNELRLVQATTSPLTLTLYVYTQG